MGRFQLIIFLILPLFGFAQDYPRFELYQLVQGADSGQFVTTGVDSNLDFNSVLRFRFQDSTLLIGSDTVITDADIVPILLATIDAGLGIEVNQVNGQIFIESLSIEDSIYNGSGSIIAKGTPLYASDTQGNYWDVAPARADDPSKMPVVVIAGEEIGIGEVGLGLIKGHIKQVNTTGLADGAEVYVGATGGYTSTKPTDEGVIIQRLGTVIKGETTNGSGIINLGDEGLWNDYTSLTKLRDTLVLVRGSITTEIADSLTNYASRTELADTANNIRLSIPIQIGDSLTNYASRTELADTANNIRLDIPTYISDSLLNYVSRIELGDSLDLYPNRTELGDTALAIRNTIPIEIGDSLVNYASRTELADTATAIRADFPAAGGDVTTAQLADTASAIRGDIPSLPLTLGTQTDGNYIATGGTSGNGLSGSATGEGSTFTVTSNATTNNTANTIVFRNASGNFSAGTITAALSGNSSTATKLQTARTISLTSDVTGSASFDGSADASITATVVDNSHNHIISNVDFLSDSLTALRTAINAGGGGGVSATNQGNNKIPTFDGVNNIIDGLNNYWINDFGEMVDNLSDGTSPNPVGYKFKIDSRLFADSIESNVIETASGGKANLNTLTTTGTTTFSGTIGGNNTTVLPSGQIGINETPSGNLSLTTYWGALFNNDQYNGVNGDFTVRSANKSSMFFIDSDLDAIGIGGATPNSSFDVNINGGVQINSSAAGGIYDGLIVQGDTDPVLFYVNADRDKVGISEALPNYTLDVDGDINFTGDLYDNGVLFSGGGVTINNNTDAYLLTATGKADTINGESGLRWSGFSLEVNGDVLIKDPGTDGGYYMRNTSTGLTSIDGFVMLLDNSTVHLNNYENTDIVLTTNNSASQRLILQNDGDVELTHYAGSGSQEIGVNNSGELIFYSSDGRYKSKVNTEIKGIEAVMKLKPIEYKWDEDMPNYDGHNELGFIAQEVKEAIPLAVPYEEKDVKILGYKHRAITATLTKAIQEQQIIIESQDKRIRQLEEMVKNLIEKK